MKLCPVCGTEYLDDTKFCPNDGQTLRAAAPDADLVGQVVADRYHVIKKLGAGGMGQVYLAEHVKMGRRSAIKVMNPSLVHDAEAVARFNREAANASRITHPNVCAIYDFGETPHGLIYLAMEFVEGEPLTDVLERAGAPPRETTATPSREVRRAPRVDAARAAGALDDLFTKLDERRLDGATVRDSARAFFDEATVAPKDRAFAVYVVANAYAALDDRPAACRWARQAVGLDAAPRAYGALVTSLCQP